MSKPLLFYMLVMGCPWWAGSQSVDATAPSPVLWENVHLHLNKTVFIPGEHLWFTAYVQDQKRKAPSLGTANLHVGIFDSKGVLHERKLLLVENGIATGNFAIDSNWSDQRYKVVAWTNYMRNFKNLRPFEQRISVIRERPTAVPPGGRVRLESYPEGGDLIGGAFNQVGIRAVDERGTGVELAGIRLLDGSGRVVRSGIGTNRHGLGKVGFVVSPENSYRLRARDENGHVVEVELPKAKAGSVGLSVENGGKDRLVFTLVADGGHLQRESGNSYSLVIYQGDHLFWEDITIDPAEPAISVARNRLPFGVNTAVLLDHMDRPVSRRLFFNDREDTSRLQGIGIDHCKTVSGDSLQLDLSLPESVKSSGADISISVLPGSTLSHAPEHSLASSFVVGPYVEAPFSRGSYYFEDMDRKKRYELDTRLLIEGWGRYDWDGREWKEVRMEFEMEQGIPLSGKIMDADLTSEQQVFLVTDQSRTMAYAELLKDKTFQTKIPLFNGDSLGVVVTGKAGKLRKPKVELVFHDLEGVKSNDLGEWIHQNDKQRIFTTHPVPATNEMFAERFSVGSRTIALEEVVVTEQRKANTKFQLTANIEGSVIDDETIQKRTTVANYLRKAGFKVFADNGGLVVVSPRYPYPIAQISINGMAANPSEVLNMPLTSVQSITYAKLVSGYAHKQASFVSILLRPNHYVPPEKRNKFVKYLVQKGYSKPQVYFDPGYADFDSKAFESYGAVYWKGRMQVEADRPLSIQIPIKGANHLLLVIEGMGTDGSLISMVKKISTNGQALETE